MINYDIDHFLWTEKYRPQKIEDCILPNKIKDELSSFLKSGNIPNLILSGSCGTGKTTSILALASELNYDVCYVNGSNEGRLFDTLRTKITNFASTVSMSGKRKIVLIDEADTMPEEVQKAYRSFIENFSANCSYVMTCNYINRIIEPVRSRFAIIDYTYPKEDKQDLMLKFFKKCCLILKENNVKFEKPAIATLIGRHYPDWRRTLHELQRISASGEITESSVTIEIDSNVKSLVEFLKNKNFKEARQWASRNIIPLHILIKNIYDNQEKYIVDASLPQFIIIAHTAQKDEGMVADKEINLVNMIVYLMAQVEWK